VAAASKFDGKARPGNRAVLASFFEGSLVRFKNLVALSVLAVFSFAGHAAAEGINITDQSGRVVLERAGTKDVPRLIGLLKGSDGFVKAQAQYALISLGKDAVPELLSALESRENVVDIVYVLNSIKDERAAGVLSGLLDLEDADALEKVESALYSLGPAAVPHLFNALNDPASRENAANTLALIKDKASYPKLYPYLKSTDAGIRACAAHVEGAWLDRGAESIMGGLLRDGQDRTRREATGYFLAISPNIETPHLEELLNDSDAQVRLNALKIIIIDRNTSYPAAIAEILKKDPDPRVRKAAVEAFYRCFKEESPPAFIAALEDRDDSVAALAAGYIGELGVKEAAPGLNALLAGRERPSDQIVESVARAFAGIREGFDPDVLLPYINWSNLYVVRSVLGAWEVAARPGDAGIKDALKNYIDMPVDNRYKDRAKKLLEKLG